MGRYLKEAYRHADKIRYFHEHAGEKGYAQALYHWDRLIGLVFSVSNSKKYKNEEPLINSIRKSMQPLMDEMEARKINPNSYL
jgi:hypothetical protein